MKSNDDKEGFFIDGFPRKLDQAKDFELIIAKPRLVLFYDCDMETLEQRLLKRAETSGRADDNIRTIKKRFKTFQETSIPVLEYYKTQNKCKRV
jgi:UMP-CMP kinase